MKLRKASQAKEMTAEQIQHSIVEDFVNNVETPLSAFIAGIRRIAEVRRQSEEVVYQQIRQEAFGLGGTANRFDQVR